MPLVRLPDAGGNTILLMEYGDKPYRNVPYVEDVANIEIRDDDVVLVSYPKSGCHWMNEIVCMLLARSTDAEVVRKENKMFEIATQKQMKELTSPRVLNTHLYFHQLPRKVQEGKVKMIFIYRNPKDVAVSFYNHHLTLTLYEYKGQKFSDYLTGLFLKGNVDFGDIFDYVRDWESVINSRPDLRILPVSYEDLHADTVGKSKELAKFLGVSVNDDMIQKIVDKCGFQKMLDRRGKEWEDVVGHPLMYRKGKVGDWKNWFSVAESEMVDSLSEERMNGSKIQFKFTL